MIRRFHPLLAVGVLVSLLGFLTVVFLEKRQIGINIFIVGFFLSLASAIYMFITTPSRELGRLGTPLRISFFGFFIYILGIIIGYFVNTNSVSPILLVIGKIVLIIGVLYAVMITLKR